MKVPVKGQWCEHDQCFDLETYLSSNQKITSRRWICPCRPNDKPLTLRRDEFTQKLLDLAKDEDVVEVNCDLEIKLKNGAVYKIFDRGFVLKGHEELMNEPDDPDGSNCDEEDRMVLSPIKQSKHEEVKRGNEIERELEKTMKE